MEVTEIMAALPMFRSTRAILGALCLAASFGTGAFAGKKKHGKPLSPAEIHKRAAPAITSIDCFDHGHKLVGTGQGFLVAENGRIISTLQFIKGCQALSVRLANGDAYDSVLVGDYDARTDIAILRIKAALLPVIPLGDSEEVQASDRVYSIEPATAAQETAVQHVVTGLRKMDGYHLIQVSTPFKVVAPGGPVLDDQGRAVGIVAHAIGGEESAGFAIPINYAAGYLETKTEETFGSFVQIIKRTEGRAQTSSAITKPNQDTKPTPPTPVNTAATPGPPIQIGKDTLEVLLRQKIGIWTADDAKSAMGTTNMRGPSEVPNVGTVFQFQTPQTNFVSVSMAFNKEGKLSSAYLVPAHAIRWEEQLAYMKQSTSGDSPTASQIGDNTSYAFARSRTTFVVRPNGFVAWASIY